MMYKSRWWTKIKSDISVSETKSSESEETESGDSEDNLTQNGAKT